LEVKIQRYRDIIAAIDNNMGDKAKQAKSRDDLKQKIKALGIIHIDYIADLPIYRFTRDEKRLILDKVKAAELTLKWYNDLLGSEDLRRKEYITELQAVSKQYS
jgi:hypothetical protein